MNVKVIAGVAVVAVIVIAAAAAVVVMGGDDDDSSITKGVVYHGNGGKTTSGSDRFELTSNTVYEYRIFSKDGFGIKCWNTKADGSGTDYLAGDTINYGNGVVHLYAQWVPAIASFGWASSSTEGTLGEAVLITHGDETYEVAKSGALLDNDPWLVINNSVWTWQINEADGKFHGVAADGRKCILWVELTGECKVVNVGLNNGCPYYDFDATGGVNVLIHCSISKA